MRVFGLQAGFARLAKYSRNHTEGLSKKALFTWQVLELLRRTRNVALVCEHYQISRATLYRWKAQFNPRRAGALEERSRRPGRTRVPQYSTQLQRRVIELRKQYGWGKDKLVVLVAAFGCCSHMRPVLLEREGLHTSASTVGRILTHARERGILVEPQRMSVKMRKRRWSRPHAVRKPKDWPVQRPGDLVQVDTVDLRRHLQEQRKQFTARDMVSRWDGIEAHTRATSSLAARFLDTLQQECPFDIKAIQVDGGSEFAGQFEQECKARGICLFALPPRSPKLNGRVERAQRTHRQEYYERCDIPQTIKDHNTDLKQWQNTYNTVRPHQALEYRTPLQRLQEFGIFPNVPPPSVSHMS